MYTKIIRDADKLDIFYECIEKFWCDEKEVEDSYISEEVLNNYRNNSLIDNKTLKTPLDKLIVVLAFIFDINFEYSFEILEREKYIEKIIGMFNFENNEVAMNQMEEVKKITKEYIQRNIN